VNHRVGAARPGLLLLAGIGAVGCGGTPVEPPRPTEPVFLNQDPSVGYVGIAECRPCHLGIASTYSATGMGRSLYPLTAERVVEDFSDENEFVTSTGARYRMLERDGRYYQRQYVRDSSGREVAVQERELIWVIGSNNHNRGYVVEVDGRLFQAPVCWYPQASRWDLCPGYELKNDHFSREISTSCVFCHNGAMQLEDGERNRFRQPFPHGIGCERCHGPGQLHAERWAGQPATSARGEPDPTIVNPRRLSPERRLDLCFQCHLGDAMATERVQRSGRDLHAFRPGQPLSEVVVPFRFSHPTRHDFGLSAQGDRLLLSRCFTESGGALDCLTCHNPHISVYHEERPDDLFRRKCLGCHAEEDCAEEHRARTDTTTPDDCVACHMRRAEPDDQRFTEFTDHWIRRRIDDDERDRRESFAIEPVLVRYALGIDAGELAYYRARAAYLMGEDLPPAARAALWATAIEEFRAAIAAGQDTAEVRFYLGKAAGRRRSRSCARR